MKKVLKIIGGIILALVIVLALALGVLTITEYRPAATETVTADHPVPAVLKAGDPMTMVIWNIGYGALGDNADFFMDGGTGVYTADRDRVQQNLAGIRETLAGLDADIIALQEVDIGSDRSYRTDEREALRDVIPGGVCVQLQLAVCAVPAAADRPRGKRPGDAQPRGGPGSGTDFPAVPVLLAAADCQPEAVPAGEPHSGGGNST